MKRGDVVLVRFPTTPDSAGEPAVAPRPVPHSVVARHYAVAEAAILDICFGGAVPRR